MLDRESQGLDLKEVRLSQQAIDVNTQGMSRQFAVQAGTQAPKRMGIILLNCELPRQLTVDGFNQLTDGVMQMLESRGNLLLLVYTRDGAQQDAIFLPQFSRFLRADIAFVSQHLLIGMFAQQFKSGFQIGRVGWRQLKIKDQTAHRNQQMQPIAKESLLFGDRFAIGCIKGFPIAARTGNQMKLDCRDRHTVDQALVVLTQIQAAQYHLADHVDRLHQISSPPVVPTLRRNTRKQLPIFSPATQQLRFHVPTTALPDQCHRDQFAISAIRFRPRALEERSDRFPYIVHHDKHPGAKILEVRYHQIVLPVESLGVVTQFLPYGRIFRQSISTSIRPY